MKGELNFEIHPDDSHAPTVDGIAVELGFGIYFQLQHDAEQVELIDMDSLMLSVKPSILLRAWITKWNIVTQEYEKYREVTGHQIRVWDGKGKTWEYDGVELRIIHDDIDLETIYGEEES